MTTKFVMTDVIRKVENRIARQWIGGLGEHAKFREDSQGWWAVFESCPVSMYLGTEKPGLEASDLVRLTLERA